MATVTQERLYSISHLYTQSSDAVGSVVVLGLEMFSRTNFESLTLALKVKSLALANQVLGLARLVICQTNTATMLNCEATAGRLSSVHQQADRCHCNSLSTIVQMRRLDKRGLFSVQSTAVHACSAISAPVERVFSQSGLLLRPHWTRMSDTLLETLVFLKCSSAALGHVSP